MNGSPAAAGWQPIPGSRMGGWRKRSPSGGWTYYYPKGRFAGATHRKDQPDQPSKPSASVSPEAGRLLDQLRRNFDAKKIAHRLSHAAHHTLMDFPKAAQGLAALAKGQKPDREHLAAMFSASVTLAHVGLALTSGGLGAGAATAVKKLVMHAVLHAVHARLAHAYTGYAGATLAEHLHTFADLVKAQPLLPAGREPGGDQVPDEIQAHGVDMKVVEAWTAMIAEAVGDVLRDLSTGHQDDQREPPPPSASSPASAPAKPLQKAKHLPLIVRANL